MALFFPLAALLIPLLAGLLLALGRDRGGEGRIFLAALALTLSAALGAALSGGGRFRLLDLGEFSLTLGADGLSHFFALLFCALFLLAGIFSLDYLAGEEHVRSFRVSYLLALGALLGLCYAQNLFTFYLFYETMTLVSLPLVFHQGDQKAREGAVTYLGYSLFGAALVLFGFFGAGQLCQTTEFLPGGGGLSPAGEGNGPLVLLSAFLLLLGFGCKGGLMPLHHWLPVAHPVAPAPASAVLSAAITKAGVLGVIRGSCYLFGPEVLRGSWVQTALLVLSLVTVFSGSMLAYRERILKKRLAWSTVSQVSYVLYGLFLLTPQGYEGALLQVLFHALCKTALFLFAGAVIRQTGRTYVWELSGLGRRMPLTFAALALAALSLVGIPPFAGFVSKWELASAGLASAGGLGLLGAGTLLLSALLTGGYLFPLVWHGFLDEGAWENISRPGWKMTLPPLLLSLALLALGVFTGPLEGLTHALAGAVFGGG